jgi:hypothetical protein
MPDVYSVAPPYSGASDPQKGPDNPSSDYKAMKPYWDMIEAINGGAETMRAAGELYLPKFPEESVEDYRLRRRFAPFTNIYRDTSRNLASKPFGREAKLKDGAPQQFIDLCEDIDGQNNSFHVFASTTFQHGLDKAIDWILVEYTKAPLPSDGRARSIKEEKTAGLRPYWVHIPAERLIAAYSDMIDGEEHFIHARIREDIVERNGWEETTKCRVRVFDRKKLGIDPETGKPIYAPATYQVFEKQIDPNTKTDVWVSIEGPSPVTIGVIALVPFMTGKRKGSSWRVGPPLRDIAYLQIEEYQQESNLKSVMELTCYPMLAANGVMLMAPGEHGPSPRVPSGPRAVLFADRDNAGNHGTWEIIEPNSESLKTLIAQLEATQKNIRDLGMAPLTQTNLTVITTANVAAKAQSQLQAWALALKDALEQAFVYTGMWLNIDAKDPEVDIYTDFGVELGDDTDIVNVLKAHEDGVLSEQSAIEELKRRAFLSENLDVEEEKKRLAADRAARAAEALAVQAIDPVTGQPVLPSQDAGRQPMVMKPKPAPATPAH